ncbi:MAG: DUF2752 domain-containing protein [Ruminococcus sp.]|nr:DUF2752 domain-containing protein [Ruminococcus sp.]
MKTIRKYILIWLPPALLLAACLLQRYLYPLAAWLGELMYCPMYENMGILCPGCGGTRAALALLRGDILYSLRCNPSTLGLFIVIVLWYIELVAAKFGKKWKLFPRALWFWCIVLGALIIWAIVRNFVPEMLPPGSESSLIELFHIK